MQFSTTTQGGVIVGVDVVNEGTDAEQMDPMHKQFKKRYKRYPKQTLVDNGFATLEQIEAAATLGIEVLAPLKEEQKQLDEGGDPYAKKKGDGPGVAGWRASMARSLKALPRSRVSCRSLSRMKKPQMTHRRVPRATIGLGCPRDRSCEGGSASSHEGS